MDSSSYQHKQRYSKSGCNQIYIELLLNHTNIYAENGACECNGEYQKAQGDGYCPSAFLGPAFRIITVVRAFELDKIWCLLRRRRHILAWAFLKIWQWI